MRRPSSWIILGVCLSLIGLQLTGLHVHVGAHGFDGVPHGTHVHGAELTDHADTSSAPAHGHRGGPENGHDAAGQADGRDRNHAGDTDVSVTELVGGASKLLVFLVCIGLGLLKPQGRSRFFGIGKGGPFPGPRRDRWRPPLRAPPAFSL